ncbi:hypothetical protein CCR85_08745 [Rhodothalassium salexigens]|nr:hypothetical protein [Rhodothalassium salexigens]MBK5920126.1 hypothetical protein [Rhodothalassium salexigens]
MALVLATIPTPGVQSAGVADPDTQTAGAAAGDDGLVHTSGAFDVAQTVDRLARAVEARGFVVMARIDHGAGAARVGLDLRPSQVLIFGRPQGGTPLMQAAPTLTLDLPLKVAVYEDAHGTTRLIHTDPGWLLARHGLAERRPAIDKMRGLMTTVTAIAAGQTDGTDVP